MPVYHYTDTGRLPWILKSGELRPGRNKIGGFPDPDFLWASTAENGDKSASAFVKEYRAGLTRLVRFTLMASDFEVWPNIVKRFPLWTLDQVERLERAAGGKSVPALWRCRVNPLRRDAWAAIHTRSFRDRRWIELATDTRVVDVAQSDGLWLGVDIGAITYLSKEIVGSHGQTGYSIGHKFTD